jgi:protein-disulfide isomerase
MMNKKQYLFIIGLIIFVAILVYFMLSAKNQEIVDVKIGTLPPLGDPQANIKIIEFGDFLCPFCAKTINDLYPKINDLINNKKVVFYFRDFVIHPQALIIHNAARCANEQNKYWEFNKNVFQKFSNGVETFKKENLISLAKELNLDVQSFEKCLNENRYNKDIRNDFQDGVSAGVEATPTFFINGKKVVGLDINKIMSIINQFK